MDGARPQPDEGPLVRRLTDQGIRDPRVLAAFARVPRHFFVPDDAQAESEADRPLDIGHSTALIGPPVTTQRRSGENAIDPTSPNVPRRMAMPRPRATFQMRASESCADVASSTPSELKATSVSGAPWPRSMR